MPPSVERLPEASVRALRSAFIITTYVSCVEELVQNAIDASADHIQIYLRRDQWSCRVQDNGIGIRPADLAKLGQRYFTSKTYNQSESGLGNYDHEEKHTFGFRGEALASLTESSVVDIASRHQSLPSEGTHVLHLKGAERVSFGPAPANRHLSHAGTVIQIRDLFFKWPVRRKTANSSIDTICKAVQVLALLHPRIRFSITDLETEDNRNILAVKSHASVLDRFRCFFGKALAQEVHELGRESCGEAAVSGFLSFSSAVDRQFQFICVNGRPVQRGPLHASVAEAFANSNWMTMTESSERVERLSSPHKRQRLQALNPRKGLDRRPVFFLHLELPSYMVDVTVEPSKKTVAVQREEGLGRALFELTARALLQQGYAVKTRQARVTPSQPSLISFKRRKAHHKPVTHSKPPPPSVLISGSGHPDQHSEEQTITWIDPVTGLSTTVDARTGNTIHNLRSLDENQEEARSVQRSNRAVDRSQLLTAPDKTRATPSWMDQALSRWKSTTLAADAPLATFVDQPPISAATDVTPRLSSSAFFYGDSLGALTRDQLATAKVVSQLDQKFIVLKDLRGVLHLVDQHAASERLRVERYLRQLCSPDEQPAIASWLEEPQHVLIGKTQSATALHNLETFVRWGFTLVPPNANDEGDEENVEWSTFSVTAVPRIIEGRLKQEPHLLQSLIASFLSQLQERPQTRQRHGQQSISWTRYLGDCPRVLLDLVNSKACRGAIMFGDTLEQDQCERLVAQLAETHFPFQCAHGRPSIIPLAPLEVMNPIKKRKVDWKKLSL